MAKNSKLHRYIIIGMIIGFVVGLLLNIYQSAINENLFENILWYTKLLGKDLFIGSLKMIIAPLILASIVHGICSLPARLTRRYWIKDSYLLFSPAIAVILA